MPKLKKYKITKWLSVIPCICVMTVIFYYSNQPAVESSALSGSITERVFQLVEKLFFLNLNGNEETFYLNIFETIIRKVAHMTEYAILSITLSYAFFVFRNKGWKLVFKSQFFCILYAITDEIHQLYVPGRSGQIVDVLIDGAGGFLGCMVFMYLLQLDFVSLLRKKYSSDK